MYVLLYVGMYNQYIKNKIAFAIPALTLIFLMSTQSAYIIGGVIVIGLYFSGVFHKLVPSIAVPQRHLPASQIPSSGIKQVTYQPPTRKFCFRGICDNITTFNQTYV